MAVHHVCDGCGARIEGDDFEKVGHVIRREYCPSCAVKANDFLRRQGEIHTNAAATYKGDMELLLADMHGRLNMLPDQDA